MTVTLMKQGHQIDYEEQASTVPVDMRKLLRLAGAASISISHR